mgnify:CR=1 FL=1
MAINALGGKACSLTGAQAGIVTDKAHTKARIHSINADALKRDLAAGNVIIVVILVMAGWEWAHGRSGAPYAQLGAIEASKARMVVRPG